MAKEKELATANALNRLHLVQEQRDLEAVRRGARPEAAACRSRLGRPRYPYRTSRAGTTRTGNGTSAW